MSDTIAVCVTGGRSEQVMANANGSAAVGWYRRYTWCLDRLRSVVLLLIRLYWGWQFFVAGKGKLMNLDRTTEFFASLHIPAPKLNVIMASSTEMIGGLLLLIGLGSRLITVPLICVMVVAYITADREAVKNMFSDSDKFVSAAPFLFLYAAVIVLVFGPGVFSVDYLIGRWMRRGEGRRGFEVTQRP